MFLGVLIFSIVFFFVFRNKIDLTSRRSLKFQYRLLLIMTMVFLTNMFVNWGFFKSYSGPHTIEYYFAKWIWNVSKLMIVMNVTHIITVLIYNSRKIEG